MNRPVVSWRLGAAALVAATALISACQPEATPGASRGESLAEHQQAIQAPLSSAYCQANVTGKGLKATEDDYLPRVVACENGNASPEALKAQAIAARSTLYWHLATDGKICDGQGCQVYTCSREVEQKHRDAVSATSGQYLAYGGMLTYGFYVNGSTSFDASCRNQGTGSNNSRVTFNGGKTGTSVTQTTLGYVGPPGFGQNRGCMSQNGADCLADQGKSYTDILKFYYGDDIQIVTAPGSCVEAPASSGACAQDVDCTNNSSGQGVVCHQGACVDGCRSNGDCGSSGTCAGGSASTPGTCSNAPAELGSSCQADSDCGPAGSGRVCGTSSKNCVVGCHGSSNCGSGSSCDSTDPSRPRCVKRQEIGQPCGGDSDCHGGIEGTTRICQEGVCADGCNADSDCGAGRTCDAAAHTCSVVPPGPGDCKLEYPLVTLKGIPTPDEVRAQYAQRSCTSKVPACMLDINNLVDAKTDQKLSYNHVRLATNFTLRELTHESAQVSPYVYVDPALVEGLQRTRDIHGVIPVKTGFRTAQRQGSACQAMCGKASCQNSQGAACAMCSEHMAGKAANLKHSSPKCDLASAACSPGQFHLILDENAGGNHLHVNLGSQAVCTFAGGLSCGGPGQPSNGGNQGGGGSSGAGGSGSGGSNSGTGGSGTTDPPTSGACLNQLQQLGVSFQSTTALNVTDAVRLTGPLNGVTIGGVDNNGNRQSGTSSQPYSCELVRRLYTLMGTLRAAGITAVHGQGSYCVRCCCQWSETNQCRSDAVPSCGSKGLSNHSYGRAIDIRYLTRSNGDVLDINNNDHWTRSGTYSSHNTCGTGLAAQTGDSKFLYELACNNDQNFKTWLTPNHNSAHRNHWHIDIGSSGAGTNGTASILPPEGVLPGQVDVYDGFGEEDQCGDGPGDE